MTFDMKLCIVVILLCFWLMSGEDPTPKRRKCAAKTLKSKMAAASATGKAINKDKKDSQSPAAPSSFPVGSTVFGAPTYFPATNPWQNDQNSKLDFIMEKLTKIESNQNTFLVRLGDIENNLTQTNIKVTAIENSQTHLSDKFDDINSTTNTHKNDIQKIQGDVKKLTGENESLKLVNQKLKDDVTDLKCRSMRDNLLFFGIPEALSKPFGGSGFGAMGGGAGTMSGATSDASPMDGLESVGSTGAKSADAAPSSFSKVVETGEDCAEKVFEFCENVLKIDNPKAKIQIERAHRIGNRSAGKIRPIVAKFVLSGHKAIVKSALSGVNLNAPPYNGDFKVNDQFPPEVISRRRELIPKLIEERKKGNKATLVRDKLFVNNKFVE